MALAGAAPPAAIIEGAQRMGFNSPIYGLTENYGPRFRLCAQPNGRAAQSTCRPLQWPPGRCATMQERWC